MGNLAAFIALCSISRKRVGRGIHIGIIFSTEEIFFFGKIVKKRKFVFVFVTLVKIMVNTLL